MLTDVAGEDLSIRAIKSTDIGNAYLLRCEGKMVYHGGDLNWWNWESEGKAYCNNMTVHYHAAIEKLASAVRNEATDNNIAPEITAAMAPLDPRLGEGSEGLGIEYLLKNVSVRHVFPMHMWKSMRSSTATSPRIRTKRISSRTSRTTTRHLRFERDNGYPAKAGYPLSLPAINHGPAVLKKEVFAERRGKYLFLFL